MRNLLVRTLSGAVLTVVVVGAVLWSQWSFGVLLLAILVGGMWEFYRMARREDIYPLKWLGLVTGTALFVASFLLAVSAEQVALLPRALSVLLWLLPVFILLIPLMFVCELFLKRARPAADVGATLGGVFYVAVPLSMMAYLPLLTGEGGWNPWVILAYIFIIWANDVFAYLVGVSVGRHHLYERISPNKSWEGFFGGIVGAIAMGCLAAWWLDGSYWLWCCLAAIAAVSGVLGDLIESMFCRGTAVGSTVSMRSFSRCRSWSLIWYCCIFHKKTYYPNMKINKEGYKIIGLTGVVCFLLWALMYYLMSRHAEAGLLWFGSILLVLFWFFIVAFFREPRRVKIHDAELVFAPCDGRVVVTEMVHESEYLDREMLQISIFMSITNVHMNWVPVGGTVEYFKYHPGRFLVAWHPKSSTENERTTTVVRTPDGKEVLFRQIAGLIARRIVSYMKVGSKVEQNSVCGFIKFGSRIDILLPKDTELLVEIGDPVVGSQTPIARLK